MARNGNGNGSHQQDLTGIIELYLIILPNRGEVCGDRSVLPGDPQAVRQYC